MESFNFIAYCFMHYINSLFNHDKQRQYSLVTVYSTYGYTVMCNITPTNIIQTVHPRFSFIDYAQYNMYMGKVKAPYYWPTEGAGNKRDASVRFRHHYLLQGLYSLRRRRLISIGIPIINLRRSSDRLRFIMGIPIPVRRRLHSE